MKRIATEKIIKESWNPQGIFLYTPGLIEGFDGRFIVSIDYGGTDIRSIDGPISDYGDFGIGNQIRIYISDNRGRAWRETKARIPMGHEMLFKAGKSIYLLGHSSKLIISRSDDNGETWTAPSVLQAEGIWHQSCCAVDNHNGKVTLVYEKRFNTALWPGVGPVLMQGNENADLTKAENWTFSPMFNPEPIMAAAAVSGIPSLPTHFIDGVGPGILETNVVRIYDPKHPWYDPDDKTVILLTRAKTRNRDIENIGAVLKGIEKTDGSLAIERLQEGGYDLFYHYIPGGGLKFHVCYDEKSKLYWLVHSQISGLMHERRRLALSFSPDLICWTFAGLVAVGPSENGARNYATMIISGDDMFIVSRAGDERSKTPHDNNLVTFHKITDFRKLVY